MTQCIQRHGLRTCVYSVDLHRDLPVRPAKSGDVLEVLWEAEAEIIGVSRGKGGGGTE